MVPGEEVLIVDGLQVPVIPLVEDVGKTGAVLFWHKGPIAVKVGGTWFVITISIVAIAPHCPAMGVNV